MFGYFELEAICCSNDNLAVNLMLLGAYHLISNKLCLHNGDVNYVAKYMILYWHSNYASLVPATAVSP